MPALCLYFQIHQPYRLRPFSFFETGQGDDYFNAGLNREVMQRVASRCYAPTTQSLLRACRRYGKRFGVTFSISGTAIEQMRDYAPEALGLLKELVGTGSVELLGETYYHSLASLLGDHSEFRAQIQLHAELMEREFHVYPRVFRNTELIFSDPLAKVVEECGFVGAFVEGVSDILAGRTPHAVYRARESQLRLLPRNFWLSDLIAFRLHSGGPGETRLTAADLAQQLKSHAKDDDLVSLCLDYETFGEHHQGTSGVCDFIEHVADHLLKDDSWRFVTPSQVIAERRSAGELSFPEPRSWADQDRDLTPWQGNQMQRRALQCLYSEDLMENCPKDIWRRLQTSDHLYYMSNKGGSDGVVHQYFRPFESPYDAFVTYMNVLRAAARGRESFLPVHESGLALP
jgi:alpha-amylase